MAKIQVKNHTISAKAVSKLTGLSYGTVVNHIKQGALPAYQDCEGGKYRVDIDDMEYYAYAAWEAGYLMYNPHEELYDHMEIYGLL